MAKELLPDLPMKTLVAFFMLILMSPKSFATALVCTDSSGAAIAVLGQESTSVYSLIVKIDATTQKTFSVKRASDGTYKGLSGFMNARPELNLNAQTLKMGANLIDVDCRKYKGS